jgi:RNA polymerase sigma factor for flagellar operon FliA
MEIFEYTEENLQKRNHLAEKYFYIVNVVEHWAFKYTRAHGIATDEVFGAGLIAYMRAIESICVKNIQNEKSIKTFLYKRAMGGIIDYMRKLNPIPHTLRKKVKKLRELRQENPNITNDALRQKLKITEKQLNALKHYSGIKIQDLDAPIDSNSPDQLYLRDIIPDTNKWLENYTKKDLIKHALDSLTSEEQMVLSASYLRDVPNYAIAEQCNLSPQRISQIKFQALKKCRSVLSTG